jgi:pyruvate-formate lyase-activating enzyme
MEKTIMADRLLTFKKEVLDTVSTSFCAAKWYNASIHLGSGETMSCHLPLPHMIDSTPAELKKDPSLIHNTAHKKKMRQLMLDGDRPQECDYCWKIEDIQRENVSDRVFKSMIYDVKDIKTIPIYPASHNIVPKTLEISFDRICNFGCSYCNAGYSTTWANDIKSAGAYQHMQSDGKGAYEHDGSWADPYGKFNDGNPYVEAFFDWWPTLSKELQEIRVTGGEATMSHNFWKFMDLLETHSSDKLRLAVNTNLGMKKDTLEKLVKYTHKVNLKEFDLYTSNESTGAHAEYIRDGLNYQEWKDNLVYFLKNGKYRSVTIMMTITSLSLFSITEFMDDMIELKHQFKHNAPMLDLNILRWPSFMSPLAWPDHLKNMTREKLKTWYESKKRLTLTSDGHPVLQAGECAQIERLIDYIEVVDLPHRRVSQDKSLLWHDFKSFYEQYDARRNKDFRSTFPKEIVDWYNSITVNKTIPIIPIGDGTPNHHT